VAGDQMIGKRSALPYKSADFLGSRRSLTNQTSNIIHPASIAHVAEWQTRTAQDRMGQPVEVRVLS
jgi:hypothetical protein